MQALSAALRVKNEIESRLSTRISIESIKKRRRANDRSPFSVGDCQGEDTVFKLVGKKKRIKV